MGIKTPDTVTHGDLRPGRYKEAIRTGLPSRGPLCEHGADFSNVQSIGPDDPGREPVALETESACIATCWVLYPLDKLRRDACIRECKKTPSAGGFEE